MAADRPQVVRLRPPLIAIGVVVWLAAALFFIFLAVCAHFYDYFPADLRIARAVQDIDVPAFGGFMEFMNFIGNTTPYLILVFALVVAFGVLRKGWEALLTLFALFPGMIDRAVKDLVERPRPSPELTDVTGHATGFTFPSGHVLKTGSLFLVLFFVIPAVVPWRPARLALQAVSLVFVVSAGLGRLYIGVHWPSDILGAHLLSLVILTPPLALYLRYRRPAEYAPESRVDHP